MEHPLNEKVYGNNIFSWKFSNIANDEECNNGNAVFNIITQDMELIKGITGDGVDEVSRLSFCKNFNVGEGIIAISNCPELKINTKGIILFIRGVSPAKSCHISKSDVDACHNLATLFYNMYVQKVIGDTTRMSRIKNTIGLFI